MRSLQQNSDSGGFFDQVSQALSSDIFMSWEFWAIASTILLIGEVLTAGFLLGAFVPGTLVAAILAATGQGFQVQLWGFVVGTLVGLFLLRPMFLRKFQSNGEPSNVDALCGMDAEVVEAISANRAGRVLVRSEEWRASSKHNIPAGAQVRILRVDGNAVEVEPIA